ncbi:MAG: hypothetical protein DRJ01_11905 [Bacteroidetes bacterium]|nr:MAG: hypothetical protein DRJ01_11905 [Bacteroidota bacterium]
MFFVEKKNKNSRNSVLQLIESKRIRGESRQRIVISLGSDFPIPKLMHKEVARVITAKLQGQQYLFAFRKCKELAKSSGIGSVWMKFLMLADSIKSRLKSQRYRF